MIMKKIAVVLCGCGTLDGSEIHESVMTLLAIDRNGAEYEIFAPDAEQHHVVNHLTGQPTGEKRNMLTEAARIARGNVKPIGECNVSGFDAIIFPGGNGSAKNLFTYAIDGENCTVRDDVAKLIRAFHTAGKPVGALCIAPVMIAKVLGDVTVTVGNDPATASSVAAFGARHSETKQREVCCDTDNKVFTTPCYMLPARISDIAECADNLIKEMLKQM